MDDGWNGKSEWWKNRNDCRLSLRGVVLMDPFVTTWKNVFLRSSFLLLFFSYLFFLTILVISVLDCSDINRPPDFVYLILTLPNSSNSRPIHSHSSKNEQHFTIVNQGLQVCFIHLLYLFRREWFHRQLPLNRNWLLLRRGLCVLVDGWVVWRIIFRFGIVLLGSRQNVG